MLTLKQRELLYFIQEYFESTGISPSFDEMKKALSIASKSGIYRLIISLEERGFIRRIPKRARALQIIKVPENMRLFTRLAHDFSSTSDIKEDNFCCSTVPFMGCIAAEVSIDSVRNRMHDIPVPSTMLQKGDHYALEVKDDSMVGVGILRGDIVVMFSSTSADPGDIVLAFFDDQMAAIKRFRQKGDSIALESANSAYKTRIFHLNNIKIRGKLVGLIRQYPMNMSA
ncbi:transcriptional repressor LexA [Candidatus Liberibacter africanus]|uniref:LexA repressor n=1 Tax=Candidatus Liberibacter africanus PTSAPSY TaxID=1277257 RepID=A0A0G3I890_LIBAF|nr:transcriptional repressor LexA [Candidatus Liberibacter africanus]AKK19922.1 LexA repressor [Candidatus Liberibacter africanus PTSAPSY]QTP63766.1 transcriptional repressor LexA [Candidatus Liberibacter africanus]